MAERRPLVIVNGHPRELPAGDTIPATALPTTGGAVSGWPDRVNGMLLATDRLQDINTSNNYGRNNAYFHRVLCAQTEQVNAMSMRVNRPGSLVQGDFSSAVGLFTTSGGLLAVGMAGSIWGTGGWRQIPFTATVTINAGTQYYLAFVANGDDIPGYAAVPGYSDYNVNTAVGSYRTFRKFNVTNLNQNQDLTTNIEALTNERVYMSLIKV